MVWALSLSLATTQEIIIIFSSSAYLDVSVRQVCELCATSLQLARFPHSEIPGSSHICWSPELIAAYHVLHRLWEPRHPLCALIYFLLSIAFCAYGNAFFDKLLNPLSVCKDESLLPFIRSNNLSIVVCSSFLTSSNMSKNFSIPANV